MSIFTKKHLIHTLFIASVLAHPITARAQSKAEFDSLKAEVQALLHKTEQLEKRLLKSEAKSTSAVSDKATVALPQAIVEADEKGFGLRSADDQFFVHLSGYIQADGRFFHENGRKENRTDTFLLRRVRPILEGTVYKDYHFFIMPDFGDGKVVLQDSYIEYTHYAEAQFRVGKFREPVGLEILQSAKDLLFVERGLATNIVPLRDVGAMLSGILFDGILSYQVGIFNGVRDGASGDIDNNDDKDLAARFWLQPFKTTQLTALQGLGFGIAGTYGKENGSLAEYKTPAQQTSFNYLPGTVADGERYRIVPQMYYSYGPLGIFGEYALSNAEMSNALGADGIEAYAWQIASSYVLTGENASYKGVKPRHDLGDHGVGAVEIAARYGELHVGSTAFTHGFADASESIRAEKSFEIGLNWYLNKNVKAVLDYEHNTFVGGARDGNREDEDAILTRVQLAL